MSALTRTHRALAGLCRRHAVRAAADGGPTMAVDGRVRGYERRDGYRTVTVTGPDEGALRGL